MSIKRTYGVSLVLIFFTLLKFHVESAEVSKNFLQPDHVLKNRFESSLMSETLHQGGLGDLIRDKLGGNKIPSIPSIPSDPSIPSIPSLPGGDKRGAKTGGGKSEDGKSVGDKAGAGDGQVSPQVPAIDVGGKNATDILEGARNNITDKVKEQLREYNNSHLTCPD